MAVTWFEITSRALAGGGASFGNTGQYEFIRGMLYFAVDPKHPDSQLITDIALGPKGPDGMVHFASDVQVLKPLDPRPGGSLLLDVVNRGNRTVMAFNSPSQAVGSDQEPDLGNGFLMRHGFTLVFCGWQADVPDGRLRLHAPEALDEQGGRLTGQAYQQYDVARTTYQLLLSDRQHKPLPAADLNDPTAILIERDWPDGPPTVIPREQWSFARWRDNQPVPDPHYICLPTGFQAGKVYEIIYTAVGAPVIGLGFLAVRDCASFFRYATAQQGNPCAGTLDRAYAYGPSQTGRTIREFLYWGFNLDEQGRLVFDGLMPHTASSRLGEFNIRFGQPSSNHLRNTGNIRPLAYTDETDPITGQTDGLMRRQKIKGGVPKVIATNSAVEYWWTGAAFTHIDLTGARDIELPPNVRMYHLAGAKHGAGSLPLTDAPGEGTRQQHWSNTLDYRPAQRALLLHLDRWVRQGAEPPPSRIPRIADGTAVRRESLESAFRAIPGMGFLKALPVRRRLDFGEQMAKGIPNYPAEEGEPFVALVSAVDSDGNEAAGIRLPDIGVPLGTHTGWTLRHPDIGGAGHFMALQGAVVPFPRTRQERQALGDPRPAIEERYASKDDYLAKVHQAAQDLVGQGYLLSEDVAPIVQGAGARWDAFHEVAQLTPMGKM
ncbi:MAG: hypothetical protein HY532_06030 [Chloroflexi bacterium]|nr:hypothetical protein [Chloroflexota bacterium]